VFSNGVAWDRLGAWRTIRAGVVLESKAPFFRDVRVFVDSWSFTCFRTSRAPSIRSSTASCRTISAAPFGLCGAGCVTTVDAVNPATSLAVVRPTGTSSSWRWTAARPGPHPSPTPAWLAPLLCSFNLAQHPFSSSAAAACPYCSVAISSGVNPAGILGRRGGYRRLGWGSEGCWNSMFWWILSGILSLPSPEKMLNFPPWWN